MHDDHDDHRSSFRHDYAYFSLGWSCKWLFIILITIMKELFNRGSCSHILCLSLTPPSFSSPCMMITIRTMMMMFLPESTNYSSASDPMAACYMMSSCIGVTGEMLAANFPPLISVFVSLFGPASPYFLLMWVTHIILSLKLKEAHFPTHDHHHLYAN